MKSRSAPRVVNTRDKVRELVASARSDGKVIGFVPTMGALHEGHVSLVQASCRECGFNIVSIFVNPTQFGPGEDYERYPRDLETDLEKLGDCAVDVVYAPTAREMYGDSPATLVEPAGVALPLEGARRPVHFRGVATVVLKLFNQVGPDIAYFGQKDYQQTLVVQQTMRDLDVPVRIVVCPTVRESDGLALSSRNAYLQPDERSQATVLHGSLRLAARLVEDGERDPQQVLRRMRELFATAPLVVEDYVVLVDPATLTDVHRIDRPVLAAVAARLGKTRLIDNAILGEWLTTVE